MEVRFLGTGDAFCSGGRFHACFHLVGERASFLVDCGTTSLAALTRAGLATDALDGVVLSHLHGDHFGGLPFLLLDAAMMRKRQRPFFTLGPAGIARRLSSLTEALYPGLEAKLPFACEIAELALGSRSERSGFAVTPFAAAHSAGAEPCHALRLEMDGRVIAYSGDSGWTPALLDASRGADLFVCECSGYDAPQPGHLSLTELRRRRREIAAKRVILTHMTRPCWHTSPLFRRTSPLSSRPPGTGLLSPFRNEKGPREAALSSSVPPSGYRPSTGAPGSSPARGSRPGSR